MILRVSKVSLFGTTRSVALTPGLNVIDGVTTTGKTSFMRLLRVVLGSNYDGIVPEFQRVTHVGAEMRIGAQDVSIVRRLAQSETATVEIAAGDFAASVPAMRPDAKRPLTYGQWLTEALGLPVLRVPTAPSKPAESATQPVSIADYIRYCRLTQKEIVADVLGSSTWFKDYKRRVVFGIYFGSYDEQIAVLQEQLRTTESALRNLKRGTDAFDTFLDGTILANRAVLNARLQAAQQRLVELAAERSAARAEQDKIPEAQRLRDQVAQFDQLLSDLSEQHTRELTSATEMGELAGQLRAQSARLTKAVVSSAHFVDFEFRVCPRCGQGVHPDRGAGGDCCMLCLQPASAQVTREDLLVEQIRVEAQIDETDELRAFHEDAGASIVSEMQRHRAGRAIAAAQLDEATRTFLSDRAEALTRMAAEQADLTSTVARYVEYLTLFEKADKARGRIDVLEAELGDIEQQLAIAEQRDQQSERRIDLFEEEFKAVVERLRLPQFAEAAEPRAAINRADYTPIVNGRRIEGHSGGMCVLINVAYMVALHRTALDQGLPVPGLLMIDGINQNLGKNEYDTTRYELIWQELIRLHDEYAEQLQIIVATNDTPGFVRERNFVRLTLSEDDRLVPASPPR
ncbi:MAG: hypothetical protein JWP32_2666 [Schumannella sp.]|nr:hypothetical protein [Schumannella sp.]